MERETNYLIFPSWFLSGMNQFYLWPCCFIKVDTVSHWKKWGRTVIRKVEVDPRDVSLSWLNKGETGLGRMMRAWGQQARNSLEMNANRNLVKTQDPTLLLTHPLPHTLIHTHFGIILCNVLFIWISLRMQRSFEFRFHNLLSCVPKWLKSCYSFCTQRRYSINKYLLKTWIW